ncbi:MAG: DivIVA domain-containing protein [Solirubrobacterales bacterium]
MAVDETSLERIRKATFPPSRRGYDKREVEKFLNRLADWLETGGGDQARSDTVRRELERVGERTGSILAEAEESAQQIRSEAEREAQELMTNARAEADAARKEAESYAAEARAAADGYAKEQRSEADGYAEDTKRAADEQAQELRAKADQDAHSAIEAGQAQAQRTVDDGVNRRKDIESVISDLTGSRDKVIGELEKLTASLTSAARQHKPAGADPFATPSKLDPLEREAEESGDLDGEPEDDAAGEKRPELDIELEEDEAPPEAVEEEEPSKPEPKPSRSSRRKSRAASKSKS